MARFLIIKQNMSKNAIRNHWDNNVCDYDPDCNFAQIDEQRFLRFPYLARELEFWKDQGKTILEIGVGSGSDACLSLRSSQPKRYVLLDVSYNTIGVSKRHLEEHCLKKPYELILGDATEMGFDDQTFDRVKAIGSLHHIPDIEKVVTEISRVLKVGGDFIWMMYNKNSLRNKLVYPLVASVKGIHQSNLVLLVDGVSNPFTQLVSKSDIKKMANQAGLICDKFSTYELSRIERVILKKLSNLVERTLGWAIYVHGRKVV